jgi:hypothetical protein
VAIVHITMRGTQGETLMCTSKTITLAEYSSFQRAFDLLNKELFDNTLPQVVITLQRKSKAYGYFCQNRFAGRLEAGTVHEIAMNPDGFGNRSDEYILSTLAHETVHLWQAGSA